MRQSAVEKTAEDPESACHPEPASCCKQEGESECHNDMEMNNEKGEVSGYSPDEWKEGKRLGSHYCMYTNLNNNLLSIKINLILK